MNTDTSDRSLFVAFNFPNFSFQPQLVVFFHSGVFMAHLCVSHDPRGRNSRLPQFPGRGKVREFCIKLGQSVKSQGIIFFAG